MADQNGTSRLNEAIDNTIKMLTYAALRGVKLEPTDIANVVAAQRAVQLNNISEAQENSFWASAAAISKMIAPVTIESLEASTSKPRGKVMVSAAASAAAKYRMRTICTLIALLLFQIYWLIGATVVTDIKEIRERLQKIQIELTPLKRTLEGLKNQNKPENQAQFEKVSYQIDDYDSKLWIERISASTNFTVLKNWNIGRSLLLWQSSVKSPAASKPEKPTSEDDLEIKPTDFFLWAFTPDNMVEFQTAQIFLTALLKYILPILYGALGASAFIVRMLANEIRDITYSTESNVRYQLRFYLGAVAGFSIAWFTSESRTADSAGILQSLSPLALAFLAGYSVDLLFSVLDRMVVAFSVPEQKRTPAQTN